MARRTKRRNTRRRVSKKNKTKRRKKTKRKMRGGSGRRNPFKSRPRNRAAQGLNPDGPGRMVELVRLQESEQTENPLAFNILNKFFREVDGWFGRKSYELDHTKLGPNNKINIISAHGTLVPNIFFVVPKGLTLYLSVAAGEPHSSQLLGTWRENPDHQNSYIRVYEEGSLIQDQMIDFYPFYDDGYYRARGLLELDVPHLSVKNATEANKGIVNFLSRHKKYDDLEADRKKKEETGDTGIHLTTYKDLYFENNIDGIIDKDDLILSAIGLREKYYLSGILRLIAEARETPDSSISGVWFGTFCRFGEAIDINKFKSCQESELPLLPEDFFQGDFHYEGISDTLVKQLSLASSDPTINFKRILDEVYEKREQYDGTPYMARMNMIVRVVKYNRPLSLENVCFVFQMKQQYP